MGSFRAKVSAVKRGFLTALLLLLSISLSFLLGEGVVRVFAPQALVLLRPDIWIPVPMSGWRHRPNASTHVNSGQREVSWQTDEQGFRVGSFQTPASDKVLLALGDSFLEAMQVEHEQTMTSLLGQTLSARAGLPVIILNSGVGGWDPNQYRIELQRFLSAGSADGVLVFVYLGNDIVNVRNESYAPKLPVERHRLRLPRNLDWSEFVDSVAYPINNFLEVRSHLFILMRNRLRYALMRAGLTAYFFPDAVLVRHASSTQWDVTADILQEIAVLGGQHGLRTLFVLIPSEEEADPMKARRAAVAFGLPDEAYDLDQPRRLLMAQMRQRQLTVIDTTTELRMAVKSGLSDVYGSVDNHLGIEGHRVVARALEHAVWEEFFAAD
jgi:hypothetical protein